nr:MAG TPA: hypothetical protein [Caudoviricetes sp.]DAT87320.1 MAG TPA: hypothetical protein [Caudoviricetes sp.]
MYLNKEQFNFLKYLSNNEKIEYSSLSENEIKISKFLEEEKLISIYRSSFPRMNRDGQVRYVNGKAISISISEQGKSYIAERKHELKKLLFKDIFIPIVVSVITTLIVNGVKLLPLLIQLLEAHIP